MKKRIFKSINFIIISIILVSCEMTSSNGTNSTTGGVILNPTVVFDSNGGTLVKSQSIEKNDLLFEPEEPVKINYVFNGWFKEKALLTAWNFGTDTVTDDITLYAKWKTDTGAGSKNFYLVNSQTGLSNRLDIIYDTDIAGDVSYIVSTTVLDISSVAQFDSSGKTITTKTVASDSLDYDNYIPITSLSANVKYYVYVKYNETVEALTKTTYPNSTAGKTAITGTITGSQDTYNYTITFPSGYGSTSEKWPILICLKTWGITSPNFPGVVFQIDVYSGSTTDLQEIYNIVDTLNSFIGNDINNIDTEKIYMFGYSAGANAAFVMANNKSTSMTQSYYKPFNFIVKAILAEGARSWVQNYCSELGNTDVWLSYGDSDSEYNTQIIAALNALSGNGEHIQTIMPATGHTYVPMRESPIAMMWLMN